VTGKRFSIMLLLGIVLAFWVTWAQAELISNGSFENGIYSRTYPSYDFMRLLATPDSSSTAITGWTVTQGSVDWIGTYWQAAPGGTKSVDLSGAENSAGVLANTSLETAKDVQYMITFSLSGNFDNAAQGSRSVTVSAGNKSQTYTFDYFDGWAHDKMGWQTGTFLFTALGDTTILSFQSDTSSGYGPVIDNVSGSVVPLPGSVLLLGSGLAGLGLLRRKWGRKA
jgi:choice-of-anchor C domain-containing protein